MLLIIPCQCVSAPGYTLLDSAGFSETGRQSLLVTEMSSSEWISNLCPICV